ncbi:8-oxoguanine DNA glycosylase OGG fold protein [Amycolatopsis kentuckyensis]|uniref:8-oxoguanine DNA glycosylase OGG fold protein n=1 Tax=Amycolatopsis kentuckyensis TaxID=218823 RepID=UPI003569A9D1
MDVPATDIDALPAPDWLTPSGPRPTSVGEHRITVRQDWWYRAITSRQLPGTPPATPTLTRAEVWEAGTDVFTLLWRTLAWGSGHHLRQNSRRLDSIEADPSGVEKILTEAAGRAGRDPERAFAAFRPDRHNRIPGLGPSFFTKFLYFAGGGASDHPSLILDRVVATALRNRCGWTSLHRIGPWPPETYGRYCTLLGRWAKDLDCAPDELELALFAG